MAMQENSDARIDYEWKSVTTSDLDLEQVDSEDEDYASAPDDYQISTYPADLTLEMLYEKWLSGEITVPEFQRDFVWQPVQSSRLIESFLVGLPVPPVYVYAERRSQNYLVIDGQQRLKSIFCFFQGYFGEGSRSDKRAFRLTGLNPASRFNGKTFADLWEEDQLRLKTAVLRVVIVQQLDPDDYSSMYHVFERLNTGATLLSNQEIRNCVYQSRFSETLLRLNETPEWRKILGKETPDRRQRDVELMVRFFAMRDVSSYQKPMKDFLSRFMRKNQHTSEDVIAQNELVFRKTCIQLLDSLGERPFHVLSGFNVSVSDAVMVAFSEHLDQVPPDIDNRYKLLLEDEEFVSSTKHRTTDVVSVQERFAKANLALFG